MVRDLLSKSSKAAVLSLTIINVLPNALSELIGPVKTSHERPTPWDRYNPPKSALCRPRWGPSGSDNPLGKSSIFPIIGNGLGPGGRGRWLLRSIDDRPLTATQIIKPITRAIKPISPWTGKERRWLFAASIIIVSWASKNDRWPYREKVDQVRRISMKASLLSVSSPILYIVSPAEALSPSTPVHISEREDVELAVDDPLTTYSSLLGGRTPWFSIVPLCLVRQITAQNSVQISSWWSPIGGWGRLSLHLTYKVPTLGSEATTR